MTTVRSCAVRDLPGRHSAPMHQNGTDHFIPEGSTVSVASTTSLILTSVPPFALRVGPAEGEPEVVLITGIIADLRDVSRTLAGLTTDALRLCIKSSDTTEVLVSLPTALSEPGSVAGEILPVMERVHTAVQSMKPTRRRRKMNRTIPAGDREHSIRLIFDTGIHKNLESVQRNECNYR